MIFLAVVACVALAVSYQSSAVRRANTRTHYGFEAIEIAESAINEAAGQVVVTDVFPTSDFDLSNLIINQISTDDTGAENAMRAQYGSKGYQVNFRNVRDTSNNVVGRIFVSLGWPASTLPTADPVNFSTGLKQYDVPTTRANAANVPGFLGVDKVEMSCLGWRRDWVLPNWQDWGVLHYKATVHFDDGKSQLTRSLHVDRLFSLYCHFVTGGACTGITIGTGPPDDAEEQTTPDYCKLYVHFIKSRRNLKTVILHQ